MDFIASQQYLMPIACFNLRSLAKAGKVPTWNVHPVVNTILGNLKTAINGNYHAFSFEKYGYRESASTGLIVGSTLPPYSPGWTTLLRVPGADQKAFYG